MHIPHFIALAVLVVLLLTITILDVRRQIIPDVLNAALGLAGLATSTLVDGREFLGTAAGAALCLAVGMALAWCYRHFRGRAGIGGGDIKFLAAGAMWVGALSVPWVLLLGSLSALGTVLNAQLSGNQVTATTRLAFGPHLSLGLLAVWSWQTFRLAGG